MGKSLVAGSGTWSIPNYGGVRTAFQRKRRVAALKTATLFSRTITPLRHTTESQTPDHPLRLINPWFDAVARTCPDNRLLR